MSAKKKDVFEIGGVEVPLGGQRDIELSVSQSYSGSDVQFPVRIIRGDQPGPAVLITGAVHGDELNGTGIVREIVMASPFTLTSGTLILVPVVNILGFERKSRYLPDRRDLNRSFPGTATGSLASRVAYAVFRGLIQRCDYCVDLHTATNRRTNFPHVRADLHDPAIRRMAEAFGSTLVVHNRGLAKTLRRSASVAGHPSILFEAGEAMKVQPAVVEHGLRGIRNLLIALDMVEGEAVRPPFQAHAERTHWLRADTGGLLRFHVAPGDLVEAGQPVATCTTLLGAERAVVRAPEEGMVMGSTTLPAVKPGDPVCHLAYLEGGIAPIQSAVALLSNDSLHERLRDDLASSVTVDDATDEWT